MTEYACADRLDPVQIGPQIVSVSQLPGVESLFEAVPDIVVILNSHRQIVYANQALADAFDLPDKQSVYGLRPGEALDCIHAGASPLGCGTTKFCRSCGAVKAILQGLRGDKDTQECSVIRNPANQALELRVTSTPLLVDRSSFVIFVIQDISHEKRRYVLERVFFHDVLKMADDLRDLSERLAAAAMEERSVLLPELDLALQELTEEIMAQKALLAAEDGRLNVRPSLVRSLELLEQVSSRQARRLARPQGRIQVDAGSVDVPFTIDRTLLARVLGNMIQNALEASPTSKAVVVGCDADPEGHIVFWVRNREFMPPGVQAQVFSRSFSTKGIGRGTGAYSMKLLTEQYLGGEVTFESSSMDGTTFRLRLPIRLDRLV